MLSAIAGRGEDAYESGIVDVSKISVLSLLLPEDDIEPVGRALGEQGLMLLPVSAPTMIETMTYLPRFALVDTRAPGAFKLLERLAAPPDEVMTIAVLGPGASEGAALRAGAAATLRHPLEPADVLLYLDRFRRHQDLQAQSRELFQRNAANAFVSTSAGVISAICHEVRNPLQVMRLNLALLDDANAGDRPQLSLEERDEILRDIESALHRIDSILTSLNGLARGEKPALQRVDLAEVAKEALASIRGRRVPVELEVQPDVFGIAAPGLLHQVIVNVLNNAFDAVDSVDSPKVTVRVYATSSEARVSVRDNGPGIPPHLRTRIFEHFFSTKGVQGTGLGLAISRQAIVTMGGVLTLSGEEQPGACFRIRLPRG